MSDLSLAQRWRHRAKELRTMADEWTGDDRETLLHFATDLDAMAEHLEHRDRSKARRFSKSSRSVKGSG
jgi:hypothetical protein